MALITPHIQQLLALIAVHLPTPNHFVKSLYLLRKFLVSQFPGYHPIRIPYCSVCLGAIENHGENEQCYGALKYEFVLSDIGMQLKEKFKGIQCNLNKDSMNKLIPLYDIIL